MSPKRRQEGTWQPGNRSDPAPGCEQPCPAPLCLVGFYCRVCLGGTGKVGPSLFLLVGGWLRLRAQEETMDKLR